MSNDEDLYFTFELGDNDNIDAEFELEENDNIDCLFEINAAGTVWGKISGTLSDQEDLQAALDTLETEVQNEATTRAENDTLLQGDINTLQNDLTAEINNRATADTTLQGNINTIQTTINGYGNIVTHNVSEFATAAQGALANTALQPNDNISKLTNDVGYITSASLPTVNNSSIVFQKNGTGFDTITLNQANNDTINITVPTQTSELTNNSGFITASALDGYATENFVTSQGYITGINESDVLDALGYTPYNASNPDGFITGITSNDVITALGYTPYNSTNPSGYQANVIESIKVNNTTQTVVNKMVNITVPTTAAEVGALPDTTTINDLTTAAQQAALNSGATTTNIGQIATNTSNISSLSNTVTSNYNTLDGRITSEVNTLNGSITTEATNRQNADNALQTQIDAITSASDVFDIVGTYAELQAYDISTVPVNDIIKVLVDSTHNNAATYYRCVENNNVKSWSYIGAEGAYYTKSEADNKFVEQTITVNGQPLSSNVTLTASDVGALPSSTTIGAGVLTIQKNGSNVDTFSANATSNKTINITVPTDTNDLTNGAGFITSNALTGYATETWVSNQGYLTAITSSDVTAALGYTPYNSTNPDGYITASDLPTNYVTTDTAQDISGRKTFIGEKAIYFKQSAAADKLGFTLYNASSAELGAMEWRPNTINGNALFNLNCSQSGSNYVGFRYWSGINIVAPRPTTNGNYFIPTHITNGTLTVTSDNKGTVNISTLLPDVSNFVTNSSLATTLADYVLSSSLATVATSGSYNDLSDKPTIPTVPTNISAFTNDSGYITGINSSDVTTALGYTPYNSTNPDGFITSSALAPYALSASLATVATTGAYSDLTGTPTIPSKTSDLTNDSGFITSSALSSYQPLLVSGTNIKTINNTSVLGNGNIDTSEIFIAEYGTTTFTEVLTAYNASKVVFCYDDNNNTYAPITNYTGTDFYFSTGLINNISASYTLDNNDSWDGGTTTLATVATSGSYDDLTDKPTIPSAQVNSDWDAVSGVAQILNKPTLGTMASESASDYTKTSGLATVATSGDYDDLSNKPTIPTVSDATITFTQGGTTKGTITLNQSSDATIALDAGGSGTTIPNPAYGTSSTAAATAQKEVSISAITELNVGQVIIVHPSTTSTVASSTIKLNNFTAYPMRYNNAAITTSTDSIVWNASYVSQFVFDGTYWQFLGHGLDSNTTYSAMSISEGTTGTAPSARTMRADYLKQIIQGTKLTGLSTADNSAVVATDSILQGIGKLQAEVNNTIPADAVNYLLSDREDAFDIQSPLTMTYTHNGDGSFQNGITMNPDGTLTTGDPDLWFGFDKGFGTAIPQTAYWEFNFKFKRISTSSTAVPFFAVDDVDTNFIELYLQDYNIPQDTWIYCNVLHKEGASNVEFRYTINDSETFVNDVLSSGYTLSSNKYVNLIGLGISEVFSLDWETYYRYSPDDRRNVFTDRTLGADLSSKQDTLVSGTNIKTVNNTSLLGSGNIDTSEVFIAEYNVTTYQEVLDAYNAWKTIVCVKTQNYPIFKEVYFLTRFDWQRSGDFIFSQSIDNETNTVTLDTNDAWTISSVNLVNKSGDTMTGALELNVPIPSGDNTTRPVVLKNTEMTVGTVPSSATFTTLPFTDTNDTELARVALRNTPTERELVLVTTGFNGNTTTFKIGMKTNNTGYCTFPNTTCVDGQWVSSYQEAIGSSAQTINAGATKNIPFSNLPAKNCEVMFTISQSTNYDLAISSSIMGGTVNRALKQGSICMIMPVSSDKTIKVGNLGGGTASINFVRMCGYRVLGTNTNT